MKHFLIALAAALCLSVTALAADGAELTAVGKAVGIRMEEDGVTITGFTETGSARTAGLKEGDRIIKIDGEKITRAAEIAPFLQKGKQIAVTVERDGKENEYLLTPEEADGQILLGVKIRDGISGIGTVTYYDKDSGEYGALGHGVCDEKGALLSLRDGSLYGAEVSGVQKGKRGTAGQLLGKFDTSVPLGTVEKNTDCGIFGAMKPGLSLGSACETAEQGEAKVGDAEILTNVDGSDVQTYQVKILKLYPGEPSRNLLLEITDPALLEKTGGIVQGMSGSPILQDGKLIGAVTHVLVSDPTKGYGIFIETMRNAA